MLVTPATSSFTGVSCRSILYLAYQLLSLLLSRSLCYFLACTLPPVTGVSLTRPPAGVCWMAGEGVYHLCCEFMHAYSRSRLASYA